ncbi:MAG: integration host factor subunit alpha [Alphaproteobacteria bacterium]|jgi:integration host factor subunit alpha|nr:integration host factor subunit alpha [Alphaproteobacteria bacterium]
MATITRNDFADNLSKATGLTMSQSYKLVDLVFSEIAESLIRGEEVKVEGLGSFKILEKSARIGRNPKTGVPAVITARRVVSFKPSAELKSKVKSK